MKIASVTVIWNDEQFIYPHFKMISKLDENIVLIGRKPFIDYHANGLVSDKPDNSESILRSKFPRVKIFKHDFDYFCGDLFNLGMDKARELGCDAIIKLDPDMLLTDNDWNKLMEQINNTDWQTLLLDYPNNTIAYKKDLDHGVQANIFPVGCDPHVIKINESFIQDGVKIKTTGRQSLIKDIMVHHMTGFKPNVDENELQRVEQLHGFSGWISAPQEIKNKFYENISNNTNNQT